MHAVCDRPLLQQANIPRCYIFGTPVRLQPTSTKFAQKLRSGVRSGKFSSIRAEDKVRETLDGFLRNGNKLADTAADLLPASVPRGAAKVGVIGVGGLLAFWLLQKVLSTFLFLGLLGGAAFLWLKLSNKDGGGDGGGDGDALADAKRIMDKYR
ncbi:g1328 [Coccomyxa elongata]